MPWLAETAPMPARRKRRLRLTGARDGPHSPTLQQFLHTGADHRLRDLSPQVCEYWVRSCYAGAARREPTGSTVAARAALAGPHTMGRASEILIPARFLLTVGHFVVVVMAFHNRVRDCAAVAPQCGGGESRSCNRHGRPAQDSNVSAGLPADSSSAAVSAAANSLLAALGLAVICHAVCLAGLFLGWTLFADRLNAMHMVLHFFGGVLTSWFIIDLWGYASYW